MIKLIIAKGATVN